MQTIYFKKLLEFIFFQGFTQSWGFHPSIPVRVFVDHVTIFSSSPMQWSSLSQKIGNGWKLLFLDLTLKQIDKFRLRQ